MAFDQDRLHQLEAEYLADRAMGLERLYTALIECGGTLLQNYLNRIGFKMRRQAFHETVHDAATRFLEMYIKHPDWKCRAFPTRMMQELLYQLHGPKKMREDSAERLTNQFMAAGHEVDNFDARLFVQEIGGDPAVNGMRIVVDLYQAVYYKRAILKISGYTPKAWIYNHAVELKTIFDNTRRPKDGESA